MVITTILTILFFTELAITILAYITTFIRFVTCHKKHGCKNDNCPLRAYCNKTAQSDQEKEAIRSLKNALSSSNI